MKPPAAKSKTSKLALSALILAIVQILLAAGKFVQIPFTITEVGFLGLFTLILSILACSGSENPGARSRAKAGQSSALP